MPSMRLVDSVPFVRLARVLLSAGLLTAPIVSFGQATTPAVSTVVAFSASIPNGGLVVGADGALYGTTASTSTVTGGLVYRATVDGSSVKTLVQLQNNEAYAPNAGLLRGSDGLLYGSTRLGAVSVQADTTGTIFRVATDGKGFTILHRFAVWTGTNQDGNPINTDGAYPETALIEGSDGYLYGVTRAGGLAGTGAVFKLSRDGTDFKVLHTFGPVTSASDSGITANINGAAPTGILLQGGDGYLYGTASAGGVNGRGTIFRLHMDGSGFEVLHEFPALSSSGSPPTNAGGAAPLAGLTDGQDGRFYGVASAGGTNGVGTLFSFDPNSRLLAVLHEFEKANGSNPSGALLLGRDTKLYGTTAFGGTSSGGGDANLGTIFSIARDGTGFTKLHSFDNSQGANPAGRLLQLNDTTFLGITVVGGKCGQGTLFQYSTTGATVSGNTNCGQKKSNSGGGALAPALLLLMSVLGFARLRRRS
jgi:uncharacterized repeat protein (TIGR03803 family)